jgi:hypothetical protein
MLKLEGSKHPQGENDEAEDQVMGYRFNPPPNWPPSRSPDWVPPAGWTPDAAWGPAPDGSNLWVEDPTFAGQPSAAGADAATTPARRNRLPRHDAITAVGAVLLLAMFVGVVSGCGNKSVNIAPVAAPVIAATTPDQAAADQAAANVGDGTFRVPQDMTPGLYHASPTSTCYYARLRNAGDNTSIITNENISGELTVEIKPSDGGFDSAGCGKWKPVTAGSGSRAVTFGEGIWLAGTDIAAATYHSSGSDGCRWKVVDPGTANIFSGDLTSGPSVVSVSDGQSLFSMGCGTWTKVN